VSNLPLWSCAGVAGPKKESRTNWNGGAYSANRRRVIQPFRGKTSRVSFAARTKRPAEIFSSRFRSTPEILVIVLFQYRRYREITTISPRHNILVFLPLPSVSPLLFYTNAVQIFFSFLYLFLFFVFAPRRRARVQNVGYTRSRVTDNRTCLPLIPERLPHSNVQPSRSPSLLFFRLRF